MTPNHDTTHLEKPVAVVGLGKIGLPLAIQYVRHGRRVIGCDISAHVVETINAGTSHVAEEAGLEDDVARAVEQRMLRATQDTTAAVREAAVVVVIVPVMVGPSRDIDFAAIDAATESVGAGLQRGTLVIYETTLPVGTTATRLRRILEDRSGLEAGRDFHLAYSPERVSSGSIFRDLATYPKVVGGVDARSTEAAVAFYRSVLPAEIIAMAGINDAEFVKLIETTYRDVNIALANEYARYADAHGLDLGKAISAANTQPYSHVHSPSVGVGGHCIPVYPYFLFSGEAQGLGLPRMARAVNDGMAAYGVQRIEDVIGPVAGRSVLLLGVSYRGDVKETAFSSAFLLREALRARGATIYADDPLYSEKELEALGFMPFCDEVKDEIQAIVVQANHRAYQSFDFPSFRHCRVVLDGRRGVSREAVESAGMHYVAIGDGNATTGDAAPHLAESLSLRRTS